MEFIFMSDKAFRRLEEYHRSSIVGLLRRMDQLEKHMSVLVDQLVSEVAANKSATDSAVALLKLLMDKIQSGIDSGDLDKIQQAVNDVHADTGALAAAVVANTPAAPAPAPTPTGGSTPAPTPTA